MEIKMPIVFRGNYVVTTRYGDTETREKVQKLNIRELSVEEKESGHHGCKEDFQPTHQIIFYSFGCKRILDGMLTDNQESRVVFQLLGKEIELSPLLPSTA